MAVILVFWPSNAKNGRNFYILADKIKNLTIKLPTPYFLKSAEPISVADSRICKYIRGPAGSLHRTLNY